MNKKRLVIIGNGFDLHHGLGTNYDNYKRYLESIAPKYCQTQVLYIINWELHILKKIYGVTWKDTFQILLLVTI